MTIPSIDDDASNDGLMKKERRVRSVQQDLRLFYINLTIVDASSAVYSQVRSKMSQPQANFGFFSDTFRQKLAHRVAETASKHVPPQKITQKLAEKIPKMLMYKMSLKGLSMFAETVYEKDNYIVLQSQIQHVNPALLAQSMSSDQKKEIKPKPKKKEKPKVDEDAIPDIPDIPDMDTALMGMGAETDKEEKEDDYFDDDDDSDVESVVLDAWMKEQQEYFEEHGDDALCITNSAAGNVALVPSNEEEGFVSKFFHILQRFLAYWFPRYGRKLEREYLPTLIQSKLTVKLDEMLRKKMEKKGIVVDIQVLPETEQARYFFQRHKLIQDKMKKNK